MNDFELHVQDSDELGPGSDLVISMFAMAMLVVALVGSGVGSEVTTPRQPPEIPQVDTKPLYAKIDELLDGKARDKSRISELEAKLIALTANKPVRTAGDVLMSWDYGAVTNRPKGGAQMSKEEQQSLLSTLRRKSQSILAGQYNTIIVEGYASPEPRWRKGEDQNGHIDTNVQLAFDRADTVANVLVRAGIPRRCLGLMSYGRNRSELLYGSNGRKPNGSEQDTRDFDQAYRAKKLELLEHDLAAERRVEIRAISDPKYALCTPSELAQRLSVARLP